MYADVELDHIIFSIHTDHVHMVMDLLPCISMLGYFKEVKIPGKLGNTSTNLDSVKKVPPFRMIFPDEQEKSLTKSCVDGLLMLVETSSDTTSY